MKPFFNTIPCNINCRPEERDRINELLKVIPEKLLTPETIAAINNGDPVKLCTQPTTAKYRHAQHPLIQACYRDNILEYITTDDYARTLTSDDNHRRWLKQYESRCVIEGKVCSPHKSCEDCPYKDKRKPLFSSYEAYQEQCRQAEGAQRTSRGGYKLTTYSDPTANSALRSIEQDELHKFLEQAGEHYAKEYDLHKDGVKQKVIAKIVGRNESNVSRDFQTIDRMVRVFYEDWNA